MASLQNHSRRRRTDSREAIQLRDDVLAIVAHDLRSPIATILMAAELLQDQCGDEGARFIDMITTAANQADALIRDLVDVARIESGRFTVHPLRHRFTSILSVAAEGFAHRASRAGVSLTCDLTNVAGLMVLADYPRFAQLLSNLIDNAIKFTPAGGHVRVAARAENGFVRISVQDTGIGISPEEVPHIFERFWQASRHHRAGAGLGLAIAKGIVEAHGGQIGLASTEGAGSTFYFTLPLAAPE